MPSAGPELRVTRTFQRQRFPGDRSGADAHEAPGAAFRRFLAEAVRPGCDVIDLGTGEGRAALAAARAARRVVGVDRDPAALEAARARAGALGLSNTEFHEVDVERQGLRIRDLLRHLGVPRGFDTALAHLCVSNRILRRAAALVRAGGMGVFTALHADHWYETGSGSRFAYDQRRLLRALRAAGFEALGVEIETMELMFPSLTALRDLYLGGPQAARLRSWRADGRWERLEERFRRGRRTLTTSRITALARKSAGRRVC